MNLNANLFAALAFLLLGLEKLGLQIPPIITGLVLIAAAIAMGLFR